MNKNGQLIVVSGFAGTGKGTLMKLLLEKYDDYVLSVSATTRSPREGEQEGVHYFFKKKEEFEQMIQNGELLEYAQYVGNYYGTPKAFVDAKKAEGRDVILEIEIQGALNIKKEYPDAILLFVVPPSAQVLRQRLEGRGTETPEVIEQRLKRACEEAEGIENYDYIIVNDDLDICVEQMHQIIRAAHFAPVRRADFLAELRAGLKEFMD